MHEVIRLKLVPALPDLIQKGEYVGKVELRKADESAVSWLFISFAALSRLPVKASRWEFRLCRPKTGIISTI